MLTQLLAMASCLCVFVLVSYLCWCYRRSVERRNEAYRQHMALLIKRQQEISNEELIK